MPKRTGASHAFAALATMVLGSFLEGYLHRHVDLERIDAVVESAATVVAARADVPLGPNVTAMALTALTITILGFAWGYAYHVRILTRGN